MVTTDGGDLCSDEKIDDKIVLEMALNVPIHFHRIFLF